MAHILRRIDLDQRVALAASLARGEAVCEPQLAHATARRYWPLIGAALAERDTAAAVGHAQTLLDERQQRPPRVIEIALEAAVHTAQSGDLAAAHALLAAAQTPARDLGYL